MLLVKTFEKIKCFIHAWLPALWGLALCQKTNFSRLEDISRGTEPFRQKRSWSPGMVKRSPSCGSAEISVMVQESMAT